MNTKIIEEQLNDLEYALVKCVNCSGYGEIGRNPRITCPTCKGAGSNKIPLAKQKPQINKEYDEIFSLLISHQDELYWKYCRWLGRQIAVSGDKKDDVAFDIMQPYLTVGEETIDLMVRVLHQVYYHEKTHYFLNCFVIFSEETTVSEILKRVMKIKQGFDYERYTMREERERVNFVICAPGLGDEERTILQKSLITDEISVLSFDDIRSVVKKE